MSIGAALMLGASSPAALPPAPLAPAVTAAAPMAPVEEDDLAGCEVVGDEELGKHRGGFTWQGVNIALGAEMRTFLNGELVLRTNVTWSNGAAEHTQMVSGTLTPADASQLQAGVLTSGGISMKVGDRAVFLANQGQTALIQRTDGSIQNIVVNRASNVEARMEVDAALDLQNFGQFQEGLTADRIGRAIGDGVGEMLVGTLAN